MAMAKKLKSFKIHLECEQFSMPSLAEAVARE